MGGGNSTLRAIRIALLVGFLVLATTLHGHGSTYNTLHIVYFVLVIGLLIASFSMRGGRRSGNRQSGRGGPVGRGGFGGAPPPPPPHATPILQSDTEPGD
jgi:hypothetical protein